MSDLAATGCGNNDCGCGCGNNTGFSTEAIAAL